MSFNTAKIINVYYKSDRKPYDANGKPISYFGEDFVGSNEATEIRFYMPNDEDLGAVQCAVDVKRANGDKRYDLLTKVVDGLETYYKLELNDWYSAYVGKVTIAFKAYKGGITIVDGVITSVTAPVYVSDIFHLQIAYAPNSTEEVPPFDPSDVTTFLSALSAKLNVNNGIFVIASSLPSLVGGVYNGQWFLVKNNADGSLGKLYYINGSTAEEVELNMETLKLTPTGNGDITTNTGKLNWEQPNGTVQLGLYNDVNMEIGEDVFYYGKASATITKGQVIQFGGYQGDHILMKPAVPAEINANPKLIMGIAKHNIANGDFGYVLHFGKLDGIDTGSFVAGNLLYFSSSSINNGELTSTIPTAPNAKILMCAVIKAETSAPSNNGVYQVRITFEPKLGDLQDVNITSVANKNVLRYNSTNSRWENSADLTTAETNITEILNGTQIVGKATNDKDGNQIDTTYLKVATATSTYVPLSSKGVANGVAPLDSSNKIPSIHLPGGVDDIKEFANLASFPLVGEASIIYVALDTNKIYRWSGSAYVEISSSLALGTTNTTAFPGDRGLATETQSNNIVNGTQTLTDTRITNSAIGVVPLNINAISGTTTFLQRWQLNAVDRAYINSAGTFIGSSLQSMSGSASGLITLTLPTISTNAANANPTLVVNNANASSTGDILKVQAVGTDRLTVKQDGKVGIGTTAPIALLTIRDATQNAVVFRSEVPPSVSGAGSHSIVLGAYDTTTASKGVVLKANHNYSGANGNTFIIESDNTSGTRTERLRIDANGNVGIGTTSPAVPLHLYRSGTTDFLVESGSGGNNYTSLGLKNTTKTMYLGLGGNGETTFGVSNKMYIYDGLNNAMRMVVDTNGNVGIGTTSPNQQLEIKGAGLTYAKFSSAVNSSFRGIAFGIENDATMYGNVSMEVSGGELRHTAGFTSWGGFQTFHTNGSERLRITSAGRVGIGTTAPAHTFTVSGALSTGTSKIAIRNSEGGMAIITAGIATINNNGFTFSTANEDATVETIRAVITANGQLGVNQTSPTGQIEVKSNLTTRVPLIVDTLASQTANLAEFKSNGTNRVIFYENGIIGASALRNTNLAVQAFIDLLSTGVQIARNIADTNPALIVNLANSSATGNIQVWQKAGTAKAWITNAGGAYFDSYIFTSTGISNNADTNNALINTPSTGAIITRNINDANSALKVNLAHASSTGNILELQGAGTTQASIAKDGIANFTGTPSNAQTVDYTLVLSDKGKVVRINSSSNLTVTIPLNSSVAFPIDTELAILRYGTGTVSISPTSGVTLNSKNSERKISGQYGSVALKKIGTDEWVLVGSLEA